MGKIAVLLLIYAVIGIYFSEQKMTKSFAYFAYGSNLLQQRIRLSNPSAKRLGVGRLDGYQLTFDGHSTRWKGAPATILPRNGSSVWGAIWELDLEHMKSLDAQESGYFPFEVGVALSDGALKRCRTYQLNKVVTAVDMASLPEERKPSKIYVKTILLGAKETKLPEEYLRFLEDIPDNGYEGEVEIDLNLAKVEG